LDFLSFCQIDDLPARGEYALQADPFSRHLFVFCNPDIPDQVQAVELAPDRGG
jgi:hypothetical protein